MRRWQPRVWLSLTPGWWLTTPPNTAKSAFLLRLRHPPSFVFWWMWRCFVRLFGTLLLLILTCPPYRTQHSCSLCPLRSKWHGGRQWEWSAKPCNAVYSTPRKSIRAVGRLLRWFVQWRGVNIPTSFDVSATLWSGIQQKSRWNFSPQFFSILSFLSPFSTPPPHTYQSTSVSLAKNSFAWFSVYRNCEIVCACVCVWWIAFVFMTSGSSLQILTYKQISFKWGVYLFCGNFGTS